MKTGIHVIQRRLLPRLVNRGAQVDAPYVGILDLARMIEGLLPEPAPNRALGIVGLDALLRLGESDDAIMRRLRQSLHEGKHYFDWKQIPLVFLTEGSLEEDAHLGTVVLALNPEQRVSLSPMLGSGLKPMADAPGWWWAPQPG